jgi:hypothetical protein
MADSNGLTKADLNALEGRLSGQLVTLFNDIHKYIDERTHELRDYIGELRDYIDERTHEVRDYIDERTHELRDYIDERTRDMQTELLRGFRAYQEGATIRMEKLSADVSNINVSTDKRIAIVEQRLAELERRIIEKGL